MVAGMAMRDRAIARKEPSRITFLTPLRMTIVALLYLTGLFLLFASPSSPRVPVELCSLLGEERSAERRPCSFASLWGSVFSTLTFREALIRLQGVLLAICALINTEDSFTWVRNRGRELSSAQHSRTRALLIRSTHGEFVRLLNVQRDAKAKDSTVFHSFFSVALGPFVGFCCSP